ncbi:glucosamine-6-phosphate deaminase [Desertivirga xinjiangensis]|uniref:glucosamine-6-phosphate deaminase n=1 Tax=Desertivirga xinjiangensis TaxID=539206 RepID=UPI0021087812|nr:glucosamine-6-phosphate deaminase [Pedobacter xinjiangensis]
MLREFKKDHLTVKVFNTRSEMGEVAAAEAARVINQLLVEKDTLNIIFAAAPSQNEFLNALVQSNIDWSRINAFHMDEYVGLHPEAPQGFANFLKERVFDRVNFKSVNCLNGNAEDAEQEAERYASLLDQHPADVVLLGIGENTHIAFNDPHVADFNDTKLVKIVDLDEACRQQQVNDGCFQKITEVPTHALTLTVPALTKAKYAFCMVPSEKKAQAIYHTLTEDISADFPSTILRKHENAILYTDKDSSSLILN